MEPEVTNIPAAEQEAAYIEAPKNYAFVPFPQQVNTGYLRDLHRRRGAFSGSIQLQIKTVEPLYLGSGYTLFDEEAGLFGRTMLENGKPVIPGSSVKGELRHTARAVSDGCILYTHAERRDLVLRNGQTANCSNQPDLFHICIICDMFGMPGLSSKIFCSDFTAEPCELVPYPVPSRNNPRIKADMYMQDGYHIGYKFYLTAGEDRSVKKRKMMIHAVPENIVFTGEIKFSGLDENELMLMMFSLGIGKARFSHKLGGYRPDPFGTCNFSCTAFTLNSKQCDSTEASAYADRYAESCPDDCRSRIDVLRQILTYREA